jgi:histidyl-tRNA synthetase
MSSQAITSVRGMNDLLPPESAKWQRLEAICREILAHYGYGEIRTPVVEHTALFARGIGEATDIVEKEMYTFKDRGERSLTLRPEMTAGCARAYVEHAVHAREPVTRWWYLGPMFRYERMQTGRYRQFWQLGCEVYGVAEPTIDAEQIAMLVELYARLGVTELEVKINTVGSGDDRPRYRQALLDFLLPHKASLCPDCQRRLDTNPLRVLDCKVPTDQAIVAGAPSILDTLGEAALAHFQGVKDTLTACGVPFRVDPRLVRGLDYYTGTVFELVTTSDRLGAQGTLVGGGRYDGLVEDIGGPKTPAFGFAFGVERAVLCMPGELESFATRPALFIATRGPAARVRGTAIAHALRKAGVAVEIEHREAGMKGQFKRADKLAARFALALGDEELATGKGALREMATRAETPVDLADTDAIARALA